MTPASAYDIVRIQAKKQGYSLDGLIKQIKRERGLCRFNVSCEENPWRRTSMCRRHLRQHRHTTRQRLRFQPWRTGGPGRPPA